MKKNQKDHGTTTAATTTAERSLLQPVNRVALIDNRFGDDNQSTSPSFEFLFVGDGRTVRSSSSPRTRSRNRSDIVVGKSAIGRNKNKNKTKTKEKRESADQKTKTANSRREPRADSVAAFCLRQRTKKYKKKKEFDATP